MTISISIEPPRQADVEALLAASTAFAHSLYPEENSFLLSTDELERAGVDVYIARDEHGAACGMAALVPLGSSESNPAAVLTAELKRLFVHFDARGRGVAGHLLDRIEADAASRGIRSLALETGPLHNAAMALYRGRGYEQIDLFGQYVGEKFSVCFAKTL
ncbi:GNAT family N-acetyltransferase [Cryobacterium sp. PH29-G1]|uniref:GNAT family N-acetyltransferase n=1 Tax=Cryobacterium sp. PH29-G1 TaxID=3046211 RepID=UPI0024B8D481|nr:GNAT family N-acetyltransferase [Cryobacterium sp. PH29-G1]MDJ0350365.1 GNAT family N-acetyltransferase [Cryobacterium sp. PH29-G1]